ncbi:MAG: sigma-54-dependent Fis family transcriptional regulator [Planctomycetes bacterium]|nr:sigma-54-dependent Fis family transcriptional regulator [Planctomycetota bacterium]
MNERLDMVEKVHRNVLLISERADTIRTVLETLAARGLRGVVVKDAPSACQRLSGREWDLVVADLRTLGNQPAFIRGLREEQPELPIIAVGENSVSSAVGAMLAGCSNYVAEPAGRQELSAALDALLPDHEVSLAEAAEAQSQCLYQIAGKSPAFLNTLKLARKIAPTSMPILITGESGTGKELISYFVHRHSSRAEKPYIRVNCAAISESLLESELFGHERGAFTGAYAQRKGRFERAHGGTLLLDEISETGPRLQAQLLRVLEQQDFERVGGNELVRVNVRVVSTSNRNLVEDVEKGRFRRDLYHRLGGVHLNVPPLRERPEDVEVLTWYFVNMYAREVNRKITLIDPETLEAFSRFSWPGNVRELRNVVRSSLVLGDGPSLRLEDSQQLVEPFQPAPHSAPSAAAPGKKTLSLKELEREAIYEALKQVDSNQTKAARILGITDRTLREKLRRYRQEHSEYQPVGEESWQKVQV